MLSPNPILFADTAQFIQLERPDCPVFMFSENELRHSARNFLEGVDGLVTYAVKANPGEHIVSVLAEEGLKALDVASPVEMELVRRLAPDAAMHYNNPIKSRREIEIAWTRFGVRSYAVDDQEQIDHIAEIVPAGQEIEITIRFKADKAKKSYDFGTKFGATEPEAVTLARYAKSLGYTPSLCFHVGSQCEDAEAYARHIAAASRIAQAADIKLKRLNVGGGFPAPYPSSEAPPLDFYFATIKRAVADNFGTDSPTIIVEPGRAMVASSTAILLRVKHVRKSGAIYLNDGAYGSLMEVKFMPILPPIRVWRDHQLLKGETAPYIIFGPTCDSYDVLPQTFELPAEIDEDDWIEFGLMGAYAEASTTDFNGFSERRRVQVDKVLG